MLSDKDCWIPDLLLFTDFGSDYSKYEDALYSIFKRDFIDSKPYFRGLPIKIREYPKEFGKEEAFFHITCQDFFKTHDRNPDFRRCERIEWCRKFIENYECSGYSCIDCSGIKIWDEKSGSRMRVCLLSEECRYIVVLEQRKDYYQLITAYYIEEDHSLRKKLRHYEASLSE